jgi:hypothetical protein
MLIGIEKAQKVKGILNTFGVYDQTNDQMYTHCYTDTRPVSSL